METQAQAVVLWPLAVYFLAALSLAAVMLILSHLLGPRHSEKATVRPYESGILPTGSAWIRFDVKYYLMAMFFVIFDVEAVFIFAWAVTLHDVGWVGYVEMVVFVGILLAALFYLWRMGALQWVRFGQEKRGGRVDEYGEK